MGCSMVAWLFLLGSWFLILDSCCALGETREERQVVQVNPEGAAHKDVRRFRRRRMRLPEIPDLLAHPTASSLGAPSGRLSFGYFDQPFGLLKSTSLPFKEK